jgi:hypothetical protein
MRRPLARPNAWTAPAAGLIAGAVIAAADGLAFHGELSPFITVMLLLGVSSAGACHWGRRSVPMAAALWACLPIGHLLIHLLHWPDGLRPNTYASIATLAVASLAVTALGTGLGLILHGVQPADRGRPAYPPRG